MGKQSKHKTKRDENPKALSTKALEEKTALDLAQKNYRRAKEWLKELTRRDKQKHQPALIDCYRQLASQMLEKGLRNEANTVFEQIRLLTGRAVDGLLEAKSMTMGDDHAAAAAAAAGRLDDAPRDPLKPEEEKQLADTLVVAFDEAPALRERHPEVDRELAAVRVALESLCAGRLADARQEIRVIGHGSLFFDWRLFIKGLCAFYAGDDASARKALRRIGEGSIPFRASRPFLYVIDEGATPLSKDEPREHLLTGVCHVLNHPELDRALPRADYLWHTGRYADSLEQTMRGLNDFPTLTPGVLRSLSLFYFNIPLQMDPERQDKYFRRIHELVRRMGRPTALLLYERIRALVFDNLPFLDDNEREGLWETFLVVHDRTEGKNDRLSALVYAHLGDIFAEEIQEEQDPWCSPRRRKKTAVWNFTKAWKAYEKSLALAPDDRDVHLKLMKLYETSGNLAARNKKLDAMTRLFPDDKDVLFENGVHCIDRKAFLKGLDYLRRALLLDPLSRLYRETLVNGLSRAALHFARENKQTERCRAWMKEALEHAEGAAPDDMTMGRPCLLIRMALIEWTAGLQEEGDRLFAEAVQNGNREGWLTYFAWMIGYASRLPDNVVIRLKKEAQNVVAGFSLAGVAIALGVVAYVKPLTAQTSWIEEEGERIRKRASKVADQPCTQDDARRIIEDLLEKEWPYHDLIKRLTRNVLAGDPQSPWFLYYRFLNENVTGPFSRQRRHHAAELEKIRAVAVARNERLLINTLDREIRQIGKEMSSPERAPFDAWEDRYDFDKFMEDTDPLNSDFDKVIGGLEELIKREAAAAERPPRGKRDRHPRDAQGSSVVEPEIPF